MLNFDNISFEDGFDTAVSEKSKKNNIDDIISEASEKHNVEPELIKSIISVESSGKSKAVSSKGAKGLMQLMPDTAKSMGVEDVEDDYQNVMGGTQYISEQLKKSNGDISLALARYNAGPYAVEKHGGIPPFKETKDYIKKVQKEYKKLTGKDFNNKKNIGSLNYDNFDFETGFNKSENMEEFDFEGTSPVSFGRATPEKSKTPDLGIDIEPSDLAPGFFGKPKIVDDTKKIIEDIGKEPTDQDKIKIALQALNQTLSGISVAKETEPERKLRSYLEKEPIYDELGLSVGEPSILSEALSYPFKPGGFIAELPGQVTEADLAQSQFEKESSPAELGGELLGTAAEYFHNLPGPKKIVYKSGELKPGELGRKVGQIMTKTGFEIAGANAILRALGVGYDTVANSELWKSLGKNFGKLEQRLGLQTAADLANEMKASGASDAEILKALRKYVGKDREKVFKEYFKKAQTETRKASEAQTREFFNKEAERAKNDVLIGKRKLIEAPEQVPKEPLKTVKPVEKPGPKPPEPKTKLGKEIKMEIKETEKVRPLASLKAKEKEISQLPKPKPKELLTESDRELTGKAVAKKYGVEYVGYWKDLKKEMFNLDVGKGRKETFYADNLEDSTVKKAVETTKKKWGISDRRIKHEAPKIERRKGERRDIVLRKAVDQMSSEEKTFVIPELRRMNKKRVKEISKLKRKIITDPLTGLRNREGISNVLDRSEKAGKETQYTFIDLIGFKGLNDKVGYSAGDKALEHIGQAMKKLGLKGARTGGDEFGFVSNTADDAAKNTNRLREYFKNNPVRIDDNAGNKYDLEVLFRDGTAKVNYSAKDIPGKTKASQDIAESKKATEPLEYKRGRIHPGLKPVISKTKPAKVSKVGKNISTVRGFVKHIGKINPLNYKGEVKELSKTAQFLFKKSGVPIDDAVQQLIDDGWLKKGTTVSDFLERLRTDPKILSRDRLTEAFEKEKPSEQEVSFEPEEPPEGEYITMYAGDLPEGKKITLIESKSKQGWDIYEVKESKPFEPVKLIDGETITLKPGDKIRVLKSDIVKEKKGFFKGYGGTVLYSGIPIHELSKSSKVLGRIYEKHVGEPVWEFFSETIPVGAGKRSKFINAINKGIILNYRKDPDFIELRDDTYTKIELARKTAKELANIIKEFPKAEQVRVSQIIQGSVTQLPERYKAAFETVEKFKMLEKELQKLGILGPDNIFKQLTRKELASKFKEVKALDDRIKLLKHRLQPIIKRGKVIRKSSESTFQEVKNVITKTRTGKYKTDAKKWTKLNEDRIREALVSRGFSDGEANQMIERVKKSVVEAEVKEGTLKEITTTLEKIVTKTITTEVERIKTFSRSYMARAKGSILKDIREAHDKRNDILKRIQTHYKMSGKQYLRRAYKSIELEDNFLSKIMGYSRKRPRLKKGYNIQRKDLTHLYRTRLGEIKEAPYLVYKGLSEEYHDMFLMQMFNQISENKKWAVSAKEWDNIMHIRSRANQIEHYKDFKPLPMSDKLGKLSGAMVDQYIWDDLNQAVKVNSEILKAYDKLLNLWKIGKVPFNPATQVRNILSNTILADFAGLSPLRIDIYARSAKYFLTKSGYWEEANSNTSLFGKEWIGGEIEEFLKDVSTFKEANGSFPAQAANSIKHLLNKPLEVYQGIEQFFKLAVYIHQRESGASIKEAAKHAEAFLFNYQKIPPAIRWAKRWYSPFITFCVCENTEILTNNGWKAYDKLKRSDLILGYDIKTKTLSWQDIDYLNIFNYYGDMYHIKSRSLDILMTPEHRNVVERNYYRGPRGNQKKIPYETVIEAQDLKPQDCIIVAGKYVDAPIEKTIPDDIVRLVGWFVTDGYIVTCKNAFMINQTNPKGQNEIEKLRVRLEIDKYNVQERQFKNGNGIDKAYYIPAFIRDKVFEHVGQERQLTVGFLKKLTMKQLKILYDTMMLADGHDPKNKKTNPVFTQNENETAKNFQTLCVMLGKQCGWSKKSDGNGLSLTVTKGRKRQLKRNMPDIVQYDGVVWCPTTKTGTWVARRNGKIFITGNSYKAIPKFAETAVKRPWKIIKYGLLLAGVEEVTRRMYGESKEEVEREKKILPDYMRKTILPGQLSHLRIPYKDKYGRSKYLDLSFILPWGDIAEQWGQSHFVGRPFLPNHPFYITVAEIAFNEVMFTGQELTVKDIDEGSEYMKKLAKQIWRQAAPSLAGSYSYNKLMSAIYGEKDWALRDRSVGEAVFDVFLGLKVRSIDYNQEHARRLKTLKSRIMEIRERFSEDYERIFIRNPTPDYEHDQQRYLKLVEKKDKQIQKIFDRITEIEQ